MLTTPRSLLAVAIACSFLTACSPEPASAPTTTTPAAATANLNENDKANAYFEKAFMDVVALSPMGLTQLGIKQDYDKWDQLTDAQAEKELALAKAQLEGLKDLDVSKLDAQTSLSYQLFKQQLQDKIADDQWRLYNYPINQMYGWHSMVPSLLINQHLIDNESDAKAYIARLNGIVQLFEQL